MLKILSWNIRQGGGSRISNILKAIASEKAQIVILSEFTNNQSGILIRSQLLKLGYRYQAVTAAPQNDNSVIICSTLPGNTIQYDNIDPKYSNNIVSMVFDSISVTGVYLPHKKHHQLFEKLIEQSNSGKKYIMAGDFNTGINKIDQKGTSFWYEKEFKSLTDKNIDAFRFINGGIKEYSWYSHQGNGYRYDHTLVDKDLQSLITKCHYIHEWREKKLSDHAPMVLEIG